ncbi:hypothetical protein PPERSA_09152 [Pseudocohnilembus persalinus]|uniref:Uncharacterized protein n=1 Tax=Pseudocohnilembus persalinus TaxID=266149 RepID=A0A0V0QWZ7_PSEPJ|nr:hypothetical protein PPERSA_09152 [Pseudocohnilembus persalinus]|eukprot:KRX06750.1 hypothetical protein PPERSA_09152 [Pseudocohnilembus persalinus]
MDETIEKFKKNSKLKKSHSKSPNKSPDIKKKQQETKRKKKDDEKSRQEMLQKQQQEQMLMKKDLDRLKQEIPEIEDQQQYYHARFEYWINPVGKTGYRVKPIDFASINIQAEVPRTYNSNRLIMTAMWCSYDYISILYGYQLDYQPFYVVGGVLNIEIFEYPTLPRIENKWKMKYRKDEYEDIKKLYYPNQEGQGSYNYNNTTPIKIYFQVPSDLFINRDSLKIATFDQQSGWQMDHINEIKFLDKEQKLLSFSSNKLAPFAIVNQRIEDFPYKSWKIKRYKENTSIFTLNGRRINLVFEIGAGYVKIIEDRTLDLDEQERFNKYFKDICGVQMTPGEMLYRLQQIGINYLPKDQDSQYAILEPKSYELEQFVNVEVAKASSQFQIKCSNWNEDCGQDKVITLIKPIQDYEIDENEETDIDQMTIMWQQNKCGILKLKETDSQLDFTLAGKTLAHSNLLLTLQKNETKDNYYKKEVQDKNQMLYWNTMQESSPQVMHDISQFNSMMNNSKITPKKGLKDPRLSISIAKSSASPLKNKNSLYGSILKSKQNNQVDLKNTSCISHLQGFLQGSTQLAKPLVQKFTKIELDNGLNKEIEGNNLFKQNREEYKNRVNSILKQSEKVSRGSQLQQSTTINDFSQFKSKIGNNTNNDNSIVDKSLSQFQGLLGKKENMLSSSKKVDSQKQEMISKFGTEIQFQNSILDPDLSQQSQNKIIMNQLNLNSKGRLNNYNRGDDQNIQQDKFDFFKINQHKYKNKANNVEFIPNSIDQITQIKENIYEEKIPSFQTKLAPNQKNIQDTTIYNSNVLAEALSQQFLDFAMQKQNETNQMQVLYQQMGPLIQEIEGGMKLQDLTLNQKMNDQDIQILQNLSDIVY